MVLRDIFQQIDVASTQRDIESLVISFFSASVIVCLVNSFVRIS